MVATAVLVGFAVAPVAAQTNAPPPVIPSVPPTDIPADAARDPQSGSLIDAPGTVETNKPAPATDPPRAAAR